MIDFQLQNVQLFTKQAQSLSTANIVVNTTGEYH